METPKEYYYTYYSYEEWGRGYIGSRGCKCLPEEDVKYFGSFRDKTFKPTGKVILKSDYLTREEAYADEIILQKYFNVVENIHFANRAYQTSTKFCLSKEQQIENGKKYGGISGRKSKELGLGIFGLSLEQRIKNGKKLKELGIGIHGLTKEKRIEISKKGGQTTKKLGLGIHALTSEQRIENSKKAGSKGGKMQYENGIGIHGLSFEERSKRSRKIGLNHKKNKTGLCGLTLEERSDYGKIGGKKAAEINKKNKTSFWDPKLQSEMGKRGGAKSGSENAKKLNNQKWQCTETGYITNPGALTAYQRKRGIDSTKRVRISEG
jgi:hypothetical protein